MQFLLAGKYRTLIAFQITNAVALIIAQSSQTWFCKPWRGRIWIDSLKSNHLVEVSSSADPNTNQRVLLLRDHQHLKHLERTRHRKVYVLERDTHKLSRGTKATSSRSSSERPEGLSALKFASCSRNPKCADEPEVQSIFININLKSHNPWILVLERNLSHLSCEWEKEVQELSDWPQLYSTAFLTMSKHGGRQEILTHTWTRREI